MTYNNLRLASLYNQKYIDEYIKRYYGLPKEKIEVLPEDTGDLFRMAVLFNLGKRGLVIDLDVIGDDYGWYDGFFEIIKVNESYIEVFNIDRGSYEKLDIFYTSIGDKSKIQKGRLIYGLVMLDLSEDHPIRYLGAFDQLSEKEAKDINTVFKEYSIINNVDIFFEKVFMPRIIQYFLSPLEEVIKNNEKHIRSKYDAHEISFATMAITNMSKYALLKPGIKNIYDIDFKDYLDKEIQEGSFTIEGSIERFLVFIQDLYKLESKKNPALIPVYEELLKLNDHIFDFKSLQKESNPITSIRLIELLEQNISITDLDLEILKIPFFYEGLSDVHHPKVTPKKKLVSSQTKREFFESVYGSYELASEDDLKLIEFVNAFLYANKFIIYDDLNIIRVLPRIMTYLSTNPYIMIANTLTSIFRPQVFQEYIGRKSIDYEDLLNTIEKAIIDEEFYMIEDQDGAREILDILTILGILEYDGDNFKLTDLGYFYKQSIKGKDKKAKVLKFEF